MNKPFIICHMMTSVDGRIDCAMTEQLPGVKDYYSTLDFFNVPSRVSGRITAENEMASPGKFSSDTNTPIKKEGFYKAKVADGYGIVLDTNGTLLWNDQIDEWRPLLILTSENVSLEYLDYLNKKHISWIACGDNSVDLKRACKILIDEFNVERMAIVGGGHINAGFLAVGLIDEISILIGAGIDGRGGMTCVFDGLEAVKKVTQLKLEDVQTFKSGAVWIQYKVL